jgi:transposase-like protein
MGKESTSRRRYTEQEKADAVRMARELGIRPAARKLGIPNGTLCRWLKRAGEAEPVNAEPAPSPKKHKKVAKAYTPSQRAVVLEHAAQHGVTAASQEHGVSRWTIYEWRRKVRLAVESQDVVYEFAATESSSTAPAWGCPQEGTSFPGVRGLVSIGDGVGGRQGRRVPLQDRGAGRRGWAPLTGDGAVVGPAGPRTWGAMGRSTSLHGQTPRGAGAPRCGAWPWTRR